MEFLAINFSTAPRRAKLYGRDYLVAPLTLIVPGVLNGSQGPLFYPEDELRASVSAWNHVPIVLEHPKTSAGYVSARSSEMLEKQGCGLLLNATYNGKLTADGWFEIDRLRKLNPALLSRIENGEKVELSTGLGTTNEPAPGVHNGSSYDAVARAHQPDHLAILPHTRGACSVQDGCGINVNERGPMLTGSTGITRDHQHFVQLDKDGYGWTDWVQDHGHSVAAFVVKPQRYPEGAADGHTHSLSRDSLVDSGVTNEDQKRSLWERLGELFHGLISNVTKTEGGESLPASAYAYVPDAAKPSTWKLRIDDKAHVGAAVAALGAGFRGRKVQIPAADLPAVKAKVRAAWLKLNPDKNKGDLPPVIRNEEVNPMTDQERKSVIDGLIANECCGWKESDRDELMSLTDNQLGVLKRQTEDAQKRLEATANEARKPFKDAEGREHVYNAEKKAWEIKKPEPVSNEQAKKPKTADEWLSDAPAEIKETLANARKITEDEKSKLVDRLTANIKDDATRNQQRERLMARSLDDLRADVALLPPEPEKRSTLYAGGPGETANQAATKSRITYMGLPGEAPAAASGNGKS